MYNVRQEYNLMRPLSIRWLVAVRFLLCFVSIVTAFITDIRAHGSVSESKVELTKLRDLNFGGIFSAPTAGTVVVHPNGTVTTTGATIRNTAGDIHIAEPAKLKFNIRNENHGVNDDNQSDRRENDDNHTNWPNTNFTRHGVNVTLQLPSDDYMYKIGDNSKKMMVNSFTLLRTDGYVTVGATLNVGANQSSGKYSGTFTVTVICD
jgi:hypothetical protein